MIIIIGFILTIGVTLLLHMPAWWVYYSKLYKDYRKTIDKLPENLKNVFIDFERIYARCEHFVNRMEKKTITPELKDLLRNFYTEIAKSTRDGRPLKTALQKLFVFLTSTSYRKKENITMVIIFVSECDSKWASHRNRLPEQYPEVIDAIKNLHSIGEKPEHLSQLDEILKMIEILPVGRPNHGK